MYIIKPVQPENILTVTSLAHKALPEQYNPMIFNQFYESFPEGFIVAFHKHTLIGFLVGLKITPNVARILMLAVDEVFQKKGVGSALLLYFLREMKTIHVNRVELEVRTNNQGAIMFYKKKGFRIQETLQQFYQNGEDAYSMRKDL